MLVLILEAISVGSYEIIPKKVLKIEESVQVLESASEITFLLLLILLAKVNFILIN